MLKSDCDEDNNNHSTKIIFSHTRMKSLISEYCHLCLLLKMALKQNQRQV